MAKRYQLPDGEKIARDHLKKYLCFLIFAVIVAAVLSLFLINGSISNHIIQELSTSFLEFGALLIVLLGVLFGIHYNTLYSMSSNPEGNYEIFKVNYISNSIHLEAIIVLISLLFLLCVLAIISLIYSQIYLVRVMMFLLILSVIGIVFITYRLTVGIIDGVRTSKKD